MTRQVAMADRPERERIKFTGHAHKRLTERYPNMTINLAVYEVGDALREFRFAKTAPAWVRRESAARFPRAKMNGNGRFAWNRDLSRCYVLNRGDHYGAKCWLVVTVLPNANGR